MVFSIRCKDVGPSLRADVNPITSFFITIYLNRIVTILKCLTGRTVALSMSSVSVYSSFRH